MAVLRHVVGETLRAVRLRQRRTLREVSAAARVSLGYLSEIERGHKEPSSELLAAICEALDIPLSEVFLLVSDTLRRQETVAERAMVLGARRGSPLLTSAPSRGGEGPQVRSMPHVAA
jgi:transcriptional regulator with XRE-family HTH domain